MSRKLSLCVLVLGLAFGFGTFSRAVSRAQAQQKQSTFTAHGDGPEQVDSEESITAGANDDVNENEREEKETSANKKASAKQKTTGDEHPTGTYTGVLPGSSNPPPIVVEPGTTPATITWPGFQMRPNGTSRVFIQSTASVPVQTSMPPGKFVLKLSGAKIVAETNRLPLETRFFNTPVTRVSIASVKDGITVTLDLRAAVTPQVSSERGPSGYYFTYIDLPAGQYAQEVPVPETAAKPVDVPPQPEHTTYLDGELDQQKKAKAAGQASASAHAEIDTETPPGIKPKSSSSSSKTSAKAGIKLGK